MDKYAIYLRKSREDLEAEKNGEGETLARHKRLLTDYAARNDMFVAHIYEEIASGDTISARPEIQQLIKDCYAGHYKGIIVKDVDRLGRGNQGDMQTILDCFSYSNRNEGVLICTPVKTYDIAHNPVDRKYVEFVMFFARLEYQEIKQRYDVGKKQAIVEGNYMGASRPYGYNKVATKTSKTLEINKEEAPIVQKIFKWRVDENMTPGAIARRLTAAGVPTYTDVGEWRTSTVKDILMNPTYIGKVRWNDRMTIKSMVDGKLVASRPRSNHTAHYMEYDAKHPAIVSKELFEEAQKGFHSDKTKANLELQNPLAGLLVCQKCGYAMTYNGFKKTNAKPRVLHRPSKLCKVKSAMLSDVINAFIYGLKQYLADFEVKINNQPDVDENEIQGQIQALEKEKKKIEKILDKIFGDYESGIYTANEFVQRKAKHNNRIEQIEKQIKELEKTIPEKEEYQEKISSLYEALDLLADPDVGAKDKNEYLKTFIDRVEFSRENNDEFILDIQLK